MPDMQDIEALIFDVFGTVVDWRTSIVEELKEVGNKNGLDEGTISMQWRTGYMQNTRRIAEGGSGPSNVDVMHRELLDDLLKSPEWVHIGRAWTETTRQHLTLAWHRLNGWPDTVDGLHKLKEKYLIATLSNGNVRLLADMAKHAQLPWDMIFSTELFDTFKPAPKAYQSACHHLSLPPSKCAMVAAHLFDLRAAAKQGMYTIYIPRPDEDQAGLDTLKSEGAEPRVRIKSEGGDVDLVVNSFIELADILGKDL